MANPVNSNISTSLIALAAQGNATLVTADQQNPNHHGLHLVVDITAIATGNLTVTIQGKDQASGKYYTILASAALAATGTTVLRVYPGMTAAANVATNDILPATWRVQAVMAGGGSVTATIGGSLLA
jgi:hypothetical protein